MSIEQPSNFNSKDDFGQLEVLGEDSNGMGESETGIEELLEREIEDRWRDLGLDYGLYDGSRTEVMVDRDSSRAFLYAEAWENKLALASCTVRVCPYTENTGNKDYNGTRNYKPPTDPDVEINESKLWLFYKSNI